MRASRDAAGSPSSSSNGSGDARSDGDAQHAAVGASAAGSADAGRTELQRRRHRENMSRYRNKKKSALENMRVREQVLAAQVQSMLQLHTAQSPTYEYDAPQEHSESSQQLADPTTLSTRTSPTPMDNYVRSLTQREQLERENTALRQRVAEYQNFEGVIQEATTAETAAIDSQRSLSGSPETARYTKAVAAPEQSSEDDGDPGYWIQFVENEAPFYYVPLTDAQCFSMVAETLRQVFVFQTLNVVDKHPAAARVLRFFEWTASLTFEWDEDAQCRMMRYQFCKTFRNPARSIDETVAAQWMVLQDPVLYQKIHSVPVRLRILQRVDEDTTVMMVTAPDAAQSLKYRSVSVLSRRDYQSPEGSVGKIVVSAKQRLDLSTQVTSRGEQVVYTSGGFLHVIYMPRESADGQRGVDIEYGGRIPLPSEAQARFLMVDIGNALIRLESLLFPFRVLRSSE